LAQVPDTVDARMLEELINIASQAAAAILSVNASQLNLRDKADRSPVTAADEASERVILDALTRHWPDIPIVSEESAAPPALGERFFLVDPLDGTREFIDGEDQYTVNIALIHQGHTVAGVVGAPAMATLWSGRVGHGAERLRLTPGARPAEASERIPIQTRTRPQSRLTAMTSRSHPEAETEAYLRSLPGVERVICGSSLKFCRIAEGAADVYPRFASLSEWDVAAGHAVLAAAGGVVVTADGQDLTYGHAGFRLPPFIAWGQKI
jgi:3'(2'), 5'-bisphosphate nucleotidase